MRKVGVRSINEALLFLVVGFGFFFFRRKMVSETTGGQNSWASAVEIFTAGKIRVT